MATNSAINTQDPIQVAMGGFGVATNATPYGIVFGGTTSTGPTQQVAALGSSGQALTSSGSGLPTFAAFTPGIGTLNGTSGNVSARTVTLTATDGSSNFTCSGTTMTLGFNSLNNTGNTFLGLAAGNNGSTGANNNTVMGKDAGQTLSTGGGNSLMGYTCGQSMTNAPNNTSAGYASMAGMTTGTGNNVAMGSFAGNGLGSGGYNICLLSNALKLTSANNIHIQYDPATTTESNTIRIGYVGGSASTQTKCFIDGIVGATVTGSAVLVSSVGQLGLVSSSERYKENIVDMGNSSNGLLDLSAVSFNYKSQTDTRYGLIAEDVAEVYPSLISYTQDNQIHSVMYHELPAMLINELQEMRSRIAYLKTRLNELGA